MTDNIIKGTCLIIAAALFGCQRPDVQLPDALLSAESITFKAEKAGSRQLTIASTSSWIIDVENDWISVSPMSGSNTEEVTVSVTDNVDENGVVALPREGKITVYNEKGNSFTTLVRQEGDNYVGVEEITIEQVYGLADEQFLKVARAAVLAVDEGGFVASDDKTAIYVASAENVRPGYEVSFAGKKVDRYGIASVASDQLAVLSESGGTVNHPEPADFATLDYSGDRIAYVTATADFLEKTLFFDPSISYDVQVLTPKSDDIDLAKLSKHNVEFEAYFLGEKDGILTLALVKIVKDNGQSINDGNLGGFPVKWVIGVGNTADKINFTETFPKSGYIDAVTGGGRIQYVSLDSKYDPNNKFNRVVGSGGDPYVEGAWPGDYWEFKSDAPVSAGSILSIAFEAATSATGHKFWRLEYRDGDEWIVPTALRKETTETGETVVYTHAMLPSSSKPVQVAATVKYNHTTDAADFRLVCAANWQSSGNGALEAPNGGTMRLTLSDKTSTDWQPNIRCVAAGSADLTPAVIEVSGLEDGILTFEGNPKEPKVITVTSDADFNLTTTSSWLHIENGAGAKYEEKEVEITCDPSDLSVMRKGVITIRSAISTYDIPVIQGAAGGELAPMISVVGGNSLEVDAEGADKTVSVQANVACEVRCDVDWIEVSPVRTRALVETLDYLVAIAENESGDERTGHVTFYNETHGLESVLTIRQRGAELFSEILFSEDFEWLDPWSTASKAGRTVETDDLDANAPQLPKAEADGVTALQALEEKGYEFLRVWASGNSESECIYLQQNYLKFGKTKYQAGIVLPAVTGGGDNVTLSFDWCPMRQGSGKVDPVNLIVVVADGTDERTFEVPTHGWASGHKLEWIPASVNLTGVTVDADTKITIKQKEWEVTTANRWFLDNIKLVKK